MLNMEEKRREAEERAGQRGNNSLKAFFDPDLYEPELKSRKLSSPV